MSEGTFNLNSLVVDAEEVQNANVIQLSLFVYNMFYREVQENELEILEDSYRILKEKFYIKKKKNRIMREGFLNFGDLDKINKKFYCYYVKESPSKIRYVDEGLMIQDVRLKLITPSFTMKINVESFAERYNLRGFRITPVFSNQNTSNSKTPKTRHRDNQNHDKTSTPPQQTPKKQPQTPHKHHTTPHKQPQTPSPTPRTRAYATSQPPATPAEAD